MSYTELLASDASKLINVIYKFTNLHNDKVYIGLTKKELRTRLANHIWQMKNSNTYFHKALLKHGISNFDIEIIDSCEDSKLLDSLEIYWIDYYNSIDSNYGYNLTSGGSGYRSKRPNYKYTDLESTRNKRSNSAKQKWLDLNYRKRYKNSRTEYKKVVLLDLLYNIVNIFLTITDAEIYIKGKKSGLLRHNLSKKAKPELIVNNYIWMLYDNYLLKILESRKTNMLGGAQIV